MTDERSSVVGPADLVGGRYRLDAFIGDGAMARVFRATDTQLGRTVAVKIFRPGTAGAGDEARWDSEKKVLASLSHPALVTLFDAHTSGDGLSYLVMENIEGGTLASRLQQGPVAPADAASLVADLGEALHVVHRSGIIHRDIKPSNILLRPPVTAQHSFRAVLADFGIAHLVDTTRVTAPGVAVGTAAYIAPEQVRGAAPAPASDVYSLGLVLIEVLTGQRAFAQQTPQEAVAARLSIQPDIPGDFGYGWRSLLTAMTSLDASSRPSALDVARRGRELHSGGTAPEVTAVSVVGDSAAAAPLGIPAPPEAGTAPSTGSTAILPNSGAAPAARVMGRARRADRIGRRRGRVAVLVGSLAAVIVAATLWSVNAYGPGLPPALPPTPAPSASPTPAPQPAIQPAEDATIAPAPTDQAPADDDGAGTDEETTVDEGNGDNGNGNSGNGNSGNGNSGNGNGGNGNGGNGGNGNGNGNGNGGNGNG